MPFARPADIKVPDALLHHRPWSFFIGLAALLVGLAFQGQNLGMFEIGDLIPYEN